MYLLSGHYRQPLAFSPSELEDADRRVQRVRDALRRLDAGTPSPPDMAHHKEAFFDALANDFNTPTALAALFEWVREANRRGAGVGDADLREMLGVLGLGELTPLQSVGDVAAIDPQAVALLAQREQARAERDFARADEIREQLRALGWEIRDGPQGPELIPRRQTVILYGRNPVYEALRGRRAANVSEVWATGRRGARAVAGARPAADRRRRGDRASLRLERPSGHLRGRRPISLRLRRSPARRPRAADRRARPGPGPAEPRLDLPHRRVRRRRRRGDPRAPRRRGDARRSARPRPAPSST